MKKKTEHNSMTLSQFLLFLVIGGISVIWLCFEASMRLRYGDPLYPVDNYSQLKSHLASNSEILFPGEEVLPSGEHVKFCAYESSRKKLDPVRDGYHIGVLGEDFGYSIECSPKDDPVHQDSVPEEIRSDYLRFGIPVMHADTTYPQLEFLVGSYYYNVNAWGTAIPDDTLDTLLNITDNILQQAG